MTTNGTYDRRDFLKAATQVAATAAVCHVPSASTAGAEPSGHSRAAPDADARKERINCRSLVRPRGAICQKMRPIPFSHENRRVDQRHSTRPRFFGQTKIAVLLLEKGADVSIANNDGNTALHLASFFARPDLVEVLLKPRRRPGEEREGRNAGRPCLRRLEHGAGEYLHIHRQHDRHANRPSRSRSPPQGRPVAWRSGESEVRACS